MQTQDPGVLGISFDMNGITKPLGGFLVKMAINFKKGL